MGIFSVVQHSVDRDSGSEWVKTKTNSVHGNTAKKILDLANGRRYDQWDEAERLLVKLLKKVNNHSVWRTLFGGGKGQEDVAGIQSRSVHAQIYFALLQYVKYMYSAALLAALHLLYTLVVVSQLQWYVMSFKPLILQYKLCGYYALCIRSRIGKFFLWTVSCIKIGILVEFFLRMLPSQLHLLCM